MIKSSKVFLNVFLAAWALVVASFILMIIAALLSSDRAISVWGILLSIPLLLMIATLWFLIDTRRFSGFARGWYCFFSMLYAMAYLRVFFGTLVVAGGEGQVVTFAQEPWRIQEAYRNLFLTVGSVRSWNAGFELIIIPLSVLLPVVALVSVYEILRQILAPKRGEESRTIP